MRTLFFVRHGESEANITHAFANRGDGPALTATGRAQAEAAARELAGRDITEIHSSPLIRAAQTAEAIATRLGVPYRLEEALREYDVGELEGHANPQVWQRYADLERAWLIERRWSERHPDGESFHDVLARFGPYLQAVTAAGPGALAVVSHGGILRLMLAHFVAGIGYQAAYRLRIPNCGVVEVTADDGRLRCVQWCGRTAPTPG